MTVIPNTQDASQAAFDAADETCADTICEALEPWVTAHAAVGGHALKAIVGDHIDYFVESAGGEVAQPSRNRSTGPGGLTVDVAALAYPPDRKDHISTPIDTKQAAFDLDDRFETELLGDALYPWVIKHAAWCSQTLKEVVGHLIDAYMRAGDEAEAIAADIPDAP